MRQCEGSWAFVGDGVPFSAPAAYKSLKNTVVNLLRVPLGRPLHWLLCGLCLSWQEASNQVG
jgi:hypothetical protein